MRKVPDIAHRNMFPAAIDKLGLKKGAEIGVFEGSFSSLLLEKSSLEVLYSIDAWRRVDGGLMEESFLKATLALNQYGDRSVVIRSPSPVAADLFEDGSLDFIYIDADHRYEAVLADLNLWVPKVRRGGIISGHDYSGKGCGICKAMTTDEQPQRYKKKVKAAVNKFVSDNGIDLLTTRERCPSWWFVAK